MSREWSKECLSLLVGDLVCLAIAFGVFDSRASRTVVLMGMRGFTIAMLFKLVGIWRRERSGRPD